MGHSSPARWTTAVAAFLFLLACLSAGASAQINCACPAGGTTCTVIDGTGALPSLDIAGRTIATRGTTFPDSAIPFGSPYSSLDIQSRIEDARVSELSGGMSTVGGNPRSFDVCAVALTDADSPGGES